MLGAMAEEDKPLGRYRLHPDGVVIRSLPQAWAIAAGCDGGQGQAARPQNTNRIRLPLLTR